ncbi:MAG: polysaccharide biosynthesis/export family protein, partial [Candidatus Rokuibacteriota bacterium]
PLVASAASSAGFPAAPAFPQSGPAALNGLLQSRVSPPGGEADLPVGGGDLIEISVFEVAELSNLKVRIPLRGSITLPLLGSIPAAGRTAIELEDEIRQRLRQKYMHDPQVSVFVHEHKSQRISVIGAVRVGGVFAITSRLRLADALALAQGLTEDADHVIYLIRRLPAGTVMRVRAGAPVPRRAEPPAAGAPTEEVMVPIDLDALVNGNEELNVTLEAGDVINVPRAGSYYVGGSVEKPGPFALRSRVTVAQAIMAAGGVKDDADWSDVRVYRPKPDGGQEVLAFSLNDFETGTPAPEVQKNDVVMVGKSVGKAFFFGFLNLFKGVFGLSKPL